MAKRNTWRRSMIARLLMPLLVGLFVVSWGALPASASQSKNAAKLKAVIGTPIIRLGQTTKISIELQDAKGELVLLPSVSGLRIGPAQGPNPSTFTRIYNNRAHTKTTLTWSVPVSAEREGEFVIPPIVLKVDGERLETREFNLRVVIDTKGEDLGFMELVNPPTRVYEGQPFTIDLRFGWDRDFNVNSVDLRLPWWGQLPGTLPLASIESRSGRPNIDVGLNGRYKVQAEQLDSLTRDGREFIQLRVAQRYLASRPGVLELPGSSFEFARLLRRGGFGQPDRYEEYYVQLEGHRIEVLPVPEEGQPSAWTGAVGSLNVTRRLDRRDVDAGDSIKLTVAWSGDGNLEFFDAPDPGRMDEFSGFRLLGTQDQYAAGVRQVTYDLVPVSGDIEEVPPLGLWTFDPSLDNYREVRTEPVPIRVRSLAGAQGLEDTGEAPRQSIDIHDLRSKAVAAGGGLRRIGSLPLTLSAPVLLAGWVLLRRQVRRRGDPAAPRERARRRAQRQLAKGLSRAKGPAEQQRALHDYLSARSMEAPEAWVGRDVQASAEVTGLDPNSGALAELRLLQDRLDAGIYSGTDAGVRSADVLAVVQNLRKEGL